jgi:hypothetical protein
MNELKLYAIESAAKYTTSTSVSNHVSAIFARSTKANNTIVALTPSCRQAAPKDNLSEFESLGARTLYCVDRTAPEAPEIRAADVMQRTKTAKSLGEVLNAANVDIKIVDAPNTMFARNEVEVKRYNFVLTILRCLTHA